MFEATRLAAYLSRIRTPDPEGWISVDAALEMATAGGAAVLGFGDSIGRDRSGRARRSRHLGSTARQLRAAPGRGACVEAGDATHRRDQSACHASHRPTGIADQG
jgi:hypothetical protein